MILSHRRRWVRWIAPIPALALLGAIMWLWYSYTFLTAAHVFSGTRLSKTGVLFGATGATKFGIGLHLLVCHVHFALLLVAFYRAVLTDAGKVPADYIDRHRGLIQLFRLQHSGRPPFTRLQPTFGAPRPRAQLPGYLRGRGGPDPDLESARLAAEELDDSSAEDETALAIAPLRSRGTSPEPAVTSTSDRFQPPVLVIRRPDPHLFLDPGPHDPRFCKRCNTIKPPRAHHCSMCGRCVTKMDHHCPWVANCVGAGNYKYFYLLLFHGFWAVTLVNVVWLPMMMEWWSPFVPLSADDTTGRRMLASPDAQSSPRLLSPAEDAYGITDIFTIAHAGAGAIMGFVLSMAFMCSLAALGGMHTVLIFRGRTTLEAYISSASFPYSFGWRNNWKSVMGADWRYWFLPIITQDVTDATRDGTDWRRPVGSPASLLPDYVYPLDAEVFDGDAGGGAAAAQDKDSDLIRLSSGHDNHGAASEYESAAAPAGQG